MSELATVFNIIREHGIGFRSREFPGRAIQAITARAKDYRRLRNHLKRLDKARGNGTPEELYDLLRTDSYFRTDQKKAEILALLSMLRENPPKYLCEIGTACGGTLLLLMSVARRDAVAVSVDLNMSAARARAYSHFSQGSQRVICIRGDSRSPKVQKCVAKIVGSNRFDFMFIDGDHLYEGVKADFEAYAQYAQKGSLIAFHDIIEDYDTRYGIPTWNNTGGVPEFWKELRKHHRTEELVEDPEQDGYGIGLIKL